MSLENIVLVVAGTLSGLLAGVFYAFSVAIVPALRSITATRHIAAMQAINIRIKNPVFFLSFFGPTVLLPFAATLHRGGSQVALIVAAMLHIFGANGVTIAGNIPLNNVLEKIDVNALSDAEAERVRTEFQGRGSRWMRLHTARTLASTAATVLVFVVCLSEKFSD